MTAEQRAKRKEKLGEPDARFRFTKRPLFNNPFGGGRGGRGGRGGGGGFGPRFGPVGGP